MALDRPRIYPFARIMLQVTIEVHADVADEKTPVIGDLDGMFIPVHQTVCGKPGQTIEILRQVFGGPYLEQPGKRVEIRVEVTKQIEDQLTSDFVVALE